MCKHLQKMFGFKKHHGRELGIKVRSHHGHGGPRKHGHSGKLDHSGRHKHGHSSKLDHGEKHGHGHMLVHGHRGHHHVRPHGHRHHGEGHFGHFEHHGRKWGRKGHFGKRHHGHECVVENRGVRIVEIEEPEIGKQMALLTL